MLDRLKPYKFRGIRLKYIILLTLSLNFHTYAAITHCTLSKQTFSNFPCTVSIPFRILQNLKYPSSPSPLFKLIKHSSIFLYSSGQGEGSSEIAQVLSSSKSGTAYTTKVVSSNPAHSEVYSILLYVIKFVNDLRQVLWFYPTIELTVTIYITEILLNVALNTITLRLLFII